MASRTLRLAALLALAGGVGLPGAEVRRELFLASPGPGTAVLAATYYTRPTGR